MLTTHEILINAKKTSFIPLTLSAEQKNNAINIMADSLILNIEDILKNNSIDIKNADNSISEVMKDRLLLNEKRIHDMADGMRQVALLPDPYGEIISSDTRPNGLVINKISVPLGVVAIIYESRPNVTSDAAVLCFKSGNVCVLRSGRQAINTSKAITRALRAGLVKCGLTPDLINIIEDTSHKSADELMTAQGYVDLLIPRGGKGLINTCIQNATVPCIQTGTGICHVYVDKYADINMAVNIIENSKASRPSVCNAEEVCIVHSDIADKFLPELYNKLTVDRIKDGKHPVELRLDDRAIKIIKGTAATEKDFDTEFLDYILAIKIVDSTDEAIDHIAKHSTHHSDGIISENESEIEKFALNIDSAAVYINASTRFTDGGEFGLGCEMGISTQKLHARGPMGLHELTTYKYIVRGNGQIR